MAFGARGPKLTTAEREALARFRERRAAGGAPAMLAHVARHTPVEPAPGFSGSSRDLRAEREVRAQRDAARARREKQRERVKVPEQMEMSSCGLGTFLGRPRSNETPTHATHAVSPKHRVDRTSEDSSGDGMRARMYELAGRFKSILEGDNQAQGASRENSGTNKGLGFTVRKPSIFRGRKKAGDPDDSACNSDDDEDREQQRNDDAYFHDLMVNEAS